MYPRRLAFATISPGTIINEIAAAMYVGRWLQSFREFPPRQKPGTFNLDHVMEQVTKAHGQWAGHARRSEHRSRGAGGVTLFGDSKRPPARTRPKDTHRRPRGNSDADDELC